MKIKDELQFKKVRWVLVEKRISIAGVVYFKYKVYRKYKVKGKFKWLNNTRCIYTIFPERWNNLKKSLKENSSFYYTQSSF